MVSTLRQGCIDKMYSKVERSRTPPVVGALQEWDVRSAQAVKFENI
jgi:hypothetical protein